MKNWQFAIAMVASSVSLAVSLVAISSHNRQDETSRFATTDETKMIFEHAEDIRLAAQKSRESDLKRMDRVEQLISDLEKREGQRILDRNIEAEDRLREAIKRSQKN